MEKTDQKKKVVKTTKHIDVVAVVVVLV